MSILQGGTGRPAASVSTDSRWVGWLDNRIFQTLKPRRLQRSSSLPGPIPSKIIAYRAGRGLRSGRACSCPIRTAEFFGRGNFNPFIDAAQLLRVVLGFIESHEALSSSPVVFVGESYGGTRVATMMNMLLFSADYDRDGQAFFRDPELVESIRRHFGVNGEDELLPETVAARFGRQILIQPQLTSYQDDVHDLLYWDRHECQGQNMVSGRTPSLRPAFSPTPCVRRPHSSGRLARSTTRRRTKLECTPVTPSMRVILLSSRSW